MISGASLLLYVLFFEGGGLVFFFRARRTWNFDLLDTLKIIPVLKSISF